MNLDKKPKNTLIALLSFLLLFAVAAVLTGLSLAPRGWDYALGDLVEKNILAPRDIEDTVATDKLKDAAAAAVDPIYYINATLVNQTQLELHGFIEGLDAAVSAAHALRDEKVAEDGEFAQLRGQTLAAEDWDALLAGSTYQVLARADGLTQDLLIRILLLDATVYKDWLQDWREVNIKEIVTLLQMGVDEASISNTRQNFIQKLNDNSPDALHTFNTYAAQRFIVSTRMLDSQQTQSAMERARSEIEPVIIREGAPIVSTGTMLDEGRLQLLKKSGLLIEQSSYRRRYLAAGIISFVAITVYSVYMMASRRRIAKFGKASMLSSMAMAVALLGGFFAMQLDSAFNTVFLAVALSAFLATSNVAAMGALALSPLFALMAAGSTLDYGAALRVFIQTAAGGALGAYTVRRTTGRSGVFIGSAVCGGVMALCALAFSTLEGAALFPGTLIDILWGIGSCLVCAIISIGLLPLLEILFDVATPSRLTELGNANSPLLQRLMIEAPGTYHHSVMTAGLAEAAAAAIGANGLLVRVGSYYHDIGKLKYPQYFKENQKDENPHDNMLAKDSAAIILGHTGDGVAMAQKYKLPSDIRQMIAEHHGTTFAAYFYNKAIEEAQGEEVPVQNFRYAGPKPQTRESAILMLADSVEAAVRSLKEPTPETVEDTIRKIVKGKIDDGQLSNAALTLQEMEQINRAMIKTFGGLLHERIEYPDIQALQEKANG